MPIPFLQDPNSDNESQARRAELRLVEEKDSEVALAARPFLLYPRAIAHFVDICVVQGVSVYSSKLFSVILVSLHARAITDAGRQAAPTLREVFAYSSGQMLAASFATFSVIYFVALPLMASGRTLGLGLLGMKISSDHSQPLNMRQLVMRLAGCALNYASFGALCVIGFRQRDGRYLQDVLSRSHVSKG